MSRLLFLGLGAAMMFFGDPQAGRKRRTDVRNQIDATRRRIEHTKSVIARDATHRAHGLLVETRGALQSGAPALAEVARDAFEKLPEQENVKRRGDEARDPGDARLASGIAPPDPRHPRCPTSVYRLYPEGDRGRSAGRPPGADG